MLAASGEASAEGQPTITIGKFTSEKVCSVYENYRGAWLVIERHNNFAALRDRITSALSESGQRCMRLQPGRLVFIDETAVTTKLTRLRGRSLCGKRLPAKASFGRWGTQTFIAGL